MGKKKKIDETSECYYCERVFADENVLIQHQKAKHFKCPCCPRHFINAPAMGVHMKEVHKQELKAVPGANKGREDPKLEIVGTNGAPKAESAAKRQRLEGADGMLAATSMLQQPQIPLMSAGLGAQTSTFFPTNMMVFQQQQQQPPLYQQGNMQMSIPMPGSGPGPGPGMMMPTGTPPPMWNLPPTMRPPYAPIPSMPPMPVPIRSQASGLTMPPGPPPLSIPLPPGMPPLPPGIPPLPLPFGAANNTTNSNNLAPGADISPPPFQLAIPASVAGEDDPKEPPPPPVVIAPPLPETTPPAATTVEEPKKDVIPAQGNNIPDGLVYFDENDLSMEEKRAALDKYIFDPFTVDAFVSNISREEF